MKIRAFTLLSAIVLAAFSQSGFASDVYRLTLWNQHNGGHNDRGTAACNIEALRNKKVVWSDQNFRPPWQFNNDLAGVLSFELPPDAPKIDNIRVTITEWVGLGGGLSEIEVCKNGENITGKCKVSVSAIFDARFTAANLTDGITSSKTNYLGYWLLPDKTQGFIDIKLPRG